MSKFCKMGATQTTSQATIMATGLLTISRDFFPKTSGSIFTSHSRERPLSFSPRLGKFECNTTSDWLNRMVTANYRKIQEHSEEWVVNTDPKLL